MQLETASFTYGLLDAISPSFLDHLSATAWLVHRLHPAGAACPHCYCPIASRRRLATWEALGRVQCTGCSRTFSATTGTPLQGSTLAPRALVLMALLMAAGRDDKTIAARVGCDRSTVYRWRPLLMEPGL